MSDEDDSDFDMTEDEIDAAWAEGEPVDVVGPPYLTYSTATTYLLTIQIPPPVAAAGS